MVENLIPNFFTFFAKKDVCTEVIAPYLDAKDLAALTIVSTGTAHVFHDAYALRKDANLILQAAMDGNYDAVMTAITDARKNYGNAVWKLLLTKTWGEETHCNPPRIWESVSVLEFLAWAGDVYHMAYVLRPESEAAASLSHGFIFVSLDKLEILDESLLFYTVLTPENNISRDAITEKELHLKFQHPLNAGQLYEHMADIMTVLLKRGHVTDTNLANPQIGDMFLLNKLFEYIPDEFRQL